MWNLKNGPVLVEFDRAIDDPEEPSLKSLSPVDRLAGLELDIAAAESLEVGQPHQRTLQAWRTHLESVGPGRKQVVVDIEGRRRVPADGRAIVQRHATSFLAPRSLAIDNHANHSTASLSLIANVDQLDPVRLANRVDQRDERVSKLFGAT